MTLHPAGRHEHSEREAEQAAPAPRADRQPQRPAPAPGRRRRQQETHAAPAPATLGSTAHQRSAPATAAKPSCKDNWNFIYENETNIHLDVARVTARMGLPPRPRGGSLSTWRAGRGRRSSSPGSAPSSARCSTSPRPRCSAGVRKPTPAKTHQVLSYLIGTF